MFSMKFQFQLKIFKLTELNEIVIINRGNLGRFFFLGYRIKRFYANFPRLRSKYRSGNDSVQRDTLTRLK